MGWGEVGWGGISVRKRFFLFFMLSDSDSKAGSGFEFGFEVFRVSKKKMLGVRGLNGSDEF